MNTKQANQEYGFAQQQGAFAFHLELPATVDCCEKCQIFDDLARLKIEPMADMKKKVGCIL